MDFSEFDVKPKKKRIARTFLLEMDQLRRLKRESTNLDVPQCELVRKSLDFFLEELKKHRARRS